ncbi:MAG: hypothetical protein IKP51_00095 [Treponema sp.]|nr:hypothetical protein [Treponema sp.]
MKKFITKAIALAVLLVGGAGAFAQSDGTGDYMGDIQLVLGHETQHVSVDNGYFRWKSKNFDIGFKSFNEFKLFSFMGVGFLAGCDLTLGRSIDADNERANDGFDFLIGFDTFIGPAVTFKLADVVAVQGAVGFAWHYMGMFGDMDVVGIGKKTVDYNLYEKSMGFGFDLQGKLFPGAPLSAVLGMKGIFTGDEKYRISIDGDSDTIDDDIDLSCIRFYAGASLNL